jgi:hypothetical protein
VKATSIDAENWLAERLRNHGVDTRGLFAGLTDRHERAARFRAAILGAELSHVIVGRQLLSNQGDRVESYAHLFARVFDEPLTSTGKKAERT